MSRLLYYILILPISWLPLRLLHLISDFLFVVMFYFAAYRKKLVVTNMSRSFPEKSKDEIRDLSKKFYRHFCDIVVESLKNFSINQKQIQRRMKFVNPEVVNDQLAAGRNVILAGGHYNNWELYAVAAPLHVHGPLLAIYKPLSDQFFDGKMKSSRGKSGLEMIAIKEVARRYEELKDTPHAMIYAIDQSPSNAAKAYWLNFLGQDTACLYGTEKNAKSNYAAVVYGSITKIKRGYYEVHYQLVTAAPQDTPYGAITENVNKLLEEQILKAPQYWLWTHRRWKHKRPIAEK